MTSKKNVYIVGRDSPVGKMFFDRGYPIVFNQHEADIVVFIGGADINPALYNQKPNPAARVGFNMENDRRDLDAFKDTTTDQLLVGICRGGQFLNVMSGGSMYQHVTGHNAPHKVYDTLWDTELTVSSCHHQMMIPSRKAEVLAYAEDHGWDFFGETQKLPRPMIEPEVIWYEHTRALCFQGHPEWTPKECTDYFFNLVETFE